MDLHDFRLRKRLQLPSDVTEKIYSAIAEIDAVKNTYTLTNRLLPQTIERLTQSVIVTSTGASNRIEGNHEALSRLYGNSKWEKGGWMAALRYLPGTHASKNAVRFAGTLIRATVIPACYLPQKQEE